MGKLKIFKRASIAAAVISCGYFLVCAIATLDEKTTRYHPSGLSYEVMGSVPKQYLILAAISPLAIIGAFIVVRWILTGSLKATSQLEHHEQHQPAQSVGCTPPKHQSHTSQDVQPQQSASR